MKFRVESVNVSSAKGTPKHPVGEITVIAGHGIHGDAHAGGGSRQVSFLAAEAIERMQAKGIEVGPGSFGENIVTSGIDWATARPGDRISIGEAEFEITQIGKECHAPCAIFYAAGECIMPKEGIFVIVLKGGTIRAKDCGNHHIRPGGQG